MPSGPVPLDTLAARRKAVLERINRERRVLAQVNRQEAKAKKAARREWLCALGEAVVARFGPVTVEQLREHLPAWGEDEEAGQAARRENLRGGNHENGLV